MNSSKMHLLYSIISKEFEIRTCSSVYVNSEKQCDIFAESECEILRYKAWSLKIMICYTCGYSCSCVNGNFGQLISVSPLTLDPA